MHKTKSLCCTPETQHCKSTLLQTHTHTHTYIYKFFFKNQATMEPGRGNGNRQVKRKQNSLFLL